MISTLHPTVFILDVCSYDSKTTSGGRSNNILIIERHSSACALNTKIWLLGTRDLWNCQNWKDRGRGQSIGKKIKAPARSRVDF